MIKKILFFTLLARITIVFGDNSYSMDNVIFNNGNFIAGGSVTNEEPDRPCIKISQDGITWKSSNIDQTGSDSKMNTVYGIACNQSICVAALSDGQNILYSSDNGLNWKYIKSGFTNSDWSNVIYAEYIFVRVTRSQILYSYDGILWKFANIQSRPIYPFQFTTISYGNGIFLAYTWGPGALLASRDGINWNFLDTTKSPLDLRNFNNVVFANNAFYFASTVYNGLISTSNFSNYFILSPTYQFQYLEYHNNIMFGVINTPDKFNLYTQISYDYGKTWNSTDNTTKAALLLNHYAYGNGIYVYINAAKPKYSYDAIKWTDSKWD